MSTESEAFPDAIQVRSDSRMRFSSTDIRISGSYVKQTRLLPVFVDEMDLTPTEIRIAEGLYEKFSRSFSELFETSIAECLQKIGRLNRSRPPVKPPKERLREAAEALRSAPIGDGTQNLVAEFLSALAELLAYRVSSQRRNLLLLLVVVGVEPRDCPVWVPIPLDTSPQVAPRGPNSVFPVMIYRGGHHSSRAFGSAVLAA